MFGINHNVQKNIGKKYMAILKSKPFFEVELTNYCNIECKMCPRSKLFREKGYMDPKLFAVLLNWLPHDVNLMFSGLGEPLLNIHLCEYIKMLNKKNIHVGITTNGNLLSTSRIDELLDANIKMIQVSLNCFQEDKYKMFMQGGDFKKVIANLEYLSHIRPADLIIQISILNQLIDEKSKKQLIKFAEKRRISIFFKNIHSRGGNLDLEFMNGPAIRQEDEVCGLFPKINFITWKGDILACCQDLDGNTKIGNIKDLSLDELTVEKYNTICEGSWFDICKYCDDEFRTILFDDNSVID